MEKKKLGLTKKTKLELSKTVEGGTVKQSFSHGRVKSVTVEVKKVRTFKKNDENMKEAYSLESKISSKNDDVFSKNEDIQNNLNQESASEEEQSNENILKKLKENAQSERKQRENNISSTQNKLSPDKEDEEVKENKKNKIQKENKPTVSPASAKKTDQLEDKTKKTSTKKNRADLKKQLSLGKLNLRRQTGKITIQQAYDDEERQRSLASIRRAREKEKKSLETKSFTDNINKPIVRDVKIPEYITVQELANRMAARVAEVIKVLIKNDIAATATQSIDADTAELVVLEFGHKVKRVSEADIEIGLDFSSEDKEDAKARPPIVTVMGHVDHGKTTLLDAIRKTDVVSKEEGGITQHIGAYQVLAKDNKKITFIDTPGHSAFSSMRARGAQLTDVIVLVVAADDGVMPQTLEAIQHAKASKVPVIVAINKIDVQGADENKVINELLKNEIVAEKHGGDVPCVPISAVKGKNIDALLENIILLSEILEIKASTTQRSESIILEAKREQGRGVVASVIQKRGTLKTGDIVVAGSQWGKIRAILDDKGKNVKAISPSTPAEILGLNDVPIAGDEVIVVSNEARAREVSAYRKSLILKEKTNISSRATSMENILKNIKGGEKKLLHLVLKTDALGSKEAIINSLENIGNDEVKVEVLLSGVGGITETDVALAASNQALIIGFNVRSDLQAKKLAKQQSVNIRYYSIIYEIFDEVRALLSGLLSPIEKENFLGYALIKKVFKISKIGKIAGCLVTEGTIKKSTGIRILRDNVVIHTGNLETLKRHNDEAKEVKEGQECGISIKDFNDIQEKDVIECFEIIKTPRKLEDS